MPKCNIETVATNLTGAFLKKSFCYFVLKNAWNEAVNINLVETKTITKQSCLFASFDSYLGAEVVKSTTDRKDILLVSRETNGVYIITLDLLKEKLDTFLSVHRDRIIEKMAIREIALLCENNGIANDYPHDEGVYGYFYDMTLSLMDDMGMEGHTFFISFLDTLLDLLYDKFEDEVKKKKDERKERLMNTNEINKVLSEYTEIMFRRPDTFNEKHNQAREA